MANPVVPMGAPTFCFAVTGCFVSFYFSLGAGCTRWQERGQAEQVPVYRRRGRPGLTAMPNSVTDPSTITIHATLDGPARLPDSDRDAFPELNDASHPFYAKLPQDGGPFLIGLILWCFLSDLALGLQIWSAVVTPPESEPEFLQAIVWALLLLLDWGFIFAMGRLLWRRWAMRK